MRYFEDLQPGNSEVLDTTYELREDEIIAFAKRWDPQPFHCDPVAAALTPMQGLTASSCHTYSIAALLLSRMVNPIDGIASLKHDFELPNAARPGDILSLKVTYADKRPSKSKPDRGLITIMSELSNQAGTVVLRLRSLMLVKRRPAENRR